MLVTMVMAASCSRYALVPHFTISLQNYVHTSIKKMNATSENYEERTLSRRKLNLLYLD